MKITVQNDEAASLLPSEVKVRQQASEYARERNRQWQECELQRLRSVGWNCLNGRERAELVKLEVFSVSQPVANQPVAVAERYAL
jgi:hypothetical protein